MKGLVIAVLALTLATCAIADTYRVDWYSINAGGGSISGGNYKINCTVGQSTASFVNTTDLLHWVGFWSGDAPNPTVVSTVADAKLLADGTFVSVAGKIATSAVGDFANFFYIEESGRFCGMRVAASPASISGLARGSVVNVLGTISTLPSGERQIAGPIVIITSTATPLTPVGLPGKTLGGGDTTGGQLGVKGGSGLNNVGILVQTWGRVTATGTGYVEINDGSGVVTIDTSTLASQPVLNSYISVIGISSIYDSSGSKLRLVLPRKDIDINTH